MLVRDGEGHLCRPGVPEPHEDGVGDQRAVELADQRTALDPVRVEKRIHELRPDRRQTVEAMVEARLREAREEAGERRAVGLAG